MPAPITTTAPAAFTPIISEDTVASLRRKLLLWVAAGKPDYIPEEKEGNDNDI